MRDLLAASRCPPSCLHHYSSSLRSIVRRPFHQALSPVRVPAVTWPGLRTIAAMRLPWVALLEAWAVARLIRSPMFNRAVQKAYRKINKLPHVEAENGGGRTGPSAFDHFKDEVKMQFRELTWQKRPPRQ